MSTLHRFPQGFLWGASTSAFQIEGSVDVDGRKPSIWDEFSHTPGRTHNGEHADVACDHYRRWPEDYELISRLGLNAYRFSIAWPRILPDGRGKLNQAGIDHYRRQLEDLQRRGVRPFPTLYHWDLPLPLQRAGGWPLRDTAEAFGEYAAAVFRALGDLADDWITINEPWCASFLSHQLGQHAPGLQDWPAAIAASHHVLLAHGLAVQALRAERPAARVGIALNYTASVPASDTPEDRAAARRFDGYFNRWFTDAVYGFGYPSDMLEAYRQAGFIGAEPAFMRPGDMATIAAPTDFLAVNYYTRAIIKAAAEPWSWEEIFPDAVRTEMFWEIYPQGLEELLLRLHTHYRIPQLIVSENGCSYIDPVDADGRIRDDRRIAYIEQHLAAVQRARAAGAPVDGYFVWSLLDNFEWALGYSQRFGLVHVDYDTQQRIPRDSFEWYRRLIAAQH